MSEASRTNTLRREIGSYGTGGKAPRIVALGMQGMTALAVSRHVGCSEAWAAKVLALWRASGEGLT